MQKKHLFWGIPGITSFLLFFSVVIPFLHIEKVYQYDMYTSDLESDFTPVASSFASLTSNLPVEYSYVQTGALSFATPRTTIYLSIDKKNLAITNNSDIEVEWFLDGERFSRHLDIADTPAEMLAGETHFFTFPFVAPLFTMIEYRISSRVPLESSLISVISSDNSAFINTVSLEVPTVSATDASAIVSRKEWGADENLRYISESRVTKNKQAYIDRGSQPKVVYETATETQAREKNDYMFTLARASMPDYTKTVSMIRTENGRKLAWPIERVNGIYAIVIHHTADSMQKSLDDMTVLRAIYQYHAVSRGWGDIGYNYIIGQRGQIYEGRAGGDYVVGAHAAWNNAGTVGISVMGNFDEMNINRDQEAGLKTAIVYFAQKYGVNLNSFVPGVKTCNDGSCEYFEDLTNHALMGHRDVGTTSCPGEALYAKLEEYRESLPAQIGYTTPIWNPETSYIEPLAPEDVVTYIPKSSSTLLTSTPIASTPSSNTITNLSPNLTVPKSSVSLLSLPSTSSLPLGRTIKVKLSYPTKNSITLQSATSDKLFLVVDQWRILVPYTQTITITTTSTGLVATTGIRRFEGTTMAIEGAVIRVPSWSRVPIWDTTGKYNDNLFRKNLTVRNESGNILLVNELPLELYLRGMGEVSESDAKTLPEKVKTIIVGARSYGSYYSNPGLPDTLRKFPGEPYDLSDNPDESQRYLGYGYELRSPTVSALVDATNSEVVTYNGSVVKVWYSSSTNGRTRSYLEYCQSTGKTDCEDIPYLQSVDDPGAQGNSFLGHGVGISGVGASYFAKLGWDYQKIILYYLTGVAIQKL